VTDKRADALKDLGLRLRESASYAAGFADGIAHALHALADSPTASSPVSNDNLPLDPAEEASKECISTIRPVLEVLRDRAKAMTISDIVFDCRDRGYELRRESVETALKSAASKGVIEAVGRGRYRAVLDDQFNEPLGTIFQANCPPVPPRQDEDRFVGRRSPSSPGSRKRR